MKLIAYYSRADENYFNGTIVPIKVGNTEKAAKLIAEICGGTMFKIEQKTPYSKNYHECVSQARNDKANNARPELVGLPDDFDQYDEIYLGYPNYCGTMPMAVYTFLESLNFTGKKIHPFCTHEGSGLSNTVNDIKNIINAGIVCNGISIYGSMVENVKDSIVNWIKE